MDAFKDLTFGDFESFFRALFELIKSIFKKETGWKEEGDTDATV